VYISLLQYHLKIKTQPEYRPEVILLWQIALRIAMGGLNSTFDYRSPVEFEETNNFA